MPVVTEVIDPRSVDLVSSYADMLQVGTRNMQNFALLQAVGEARKPVLLKRGFSATIEEWLMAAEYIAQRGNLDIVLCERGIRTFETATRNTLDISAVPVAQRLSHLPVIVDPSHSGGRRDLVLPLTRAAIAVGADGIIVDVHPEPELALCDGDQALLDSDLRELASVAAHLPPLMGRTLTPPRDISPAAGRARARPGRLGIRRSARRGALAPRLVFVADPDEVRSDRAGTPARSWPVPQRGHPRPAGPRSGAGPRCGPGFRRGAGPAACSSPDRAVRTRPGSRIRRASSMISILSWPISGRRTGSATASSSAVRLARVWLLTWPSESPVTSAAEPRRRASTSPVLSISRRCATIWSRFAPEDASRRWAWPNATTYIRESSWKRSSW